MKKVFAVLVVLTLAMLQFGCVGEKSTSFKLSEIQVSGLMYADVSEYQHRIIYTGDPNFKALAAVRFNRNLKPSKELPILGMQNGNPITIRYVDWKDANGRPAPIVYNIKGKELLFLQTVGALPPGLITVTLPSTVSDKAGRILGKDFAFRLSTQYPTVHQLLLGRFNPHEEIEEDTIIPIPQDHQGGRTLYYVTAAKTPLLAQPDPTSKTRLALRVGDMVEVLKDHNSAYLRVRAYRQPPERAIRQSITGKSIQDAIVSMAEPTEGYVSRDAVAAVPRPDHPGTLLWVSHGDQVPVLTVSVWPYGVALREFGPRSPLSSNAIHALELVALSQWGELMGNLYWTTHFDTKGRKLDLLDPAAHLPQAQWSTDEYKTYKNERDSYVRWLESRWDKIQYQEGAKEIKEALRQTIFDRQAPLEEVWIEWGYERKVPDVDWFVGKVSSKLGVSIEDLRKYWAGGGTSASSESFWKGLEKFLADQASPQVYQTIKELLDKAMPLPHVAGHRH